MFLFVKNLFAIYFFIETILYTNEELHIKRSLLAVKHTGCNVPVKVNPAPQANDITNDRNIDLLGRDSDS